MGYHSHQATLIDKVRTPIKFVCHECGRKITAQVSQTQVSAKTLGYIIEVDPCKACIRKAKKEAIKAKGGGCNCDG
jgi:hypothetical protein